MSEYVGVVGKKGELYPPKELREKAGLYPGDKFIGTIVDGKILLRKKKTIDDVLREVPLATVTIEEMRKQREELERSLR